jgi:hypothetical protein
MLSVTDKDRPGPRAAVRRPHIRPVSTGFQSGDNHADKGGEISGIGKLPEKKEICCNGKSSSGA